MTEQQICRSTTELDARAAQRRFGYLIAVSALGLAVSACAAPMAELAHAPDVTGCQALGEVDTKDPRASHDDQVVALREAAAEKGATHVVEDSATAGAPVRGQMYQCAPPEKPPTRSEQRSGF